MMRIAAFTLALGLLVASPALAKPGDGECLWSHAPAKTRDTIVKAARSGGMTDLDAVFDSELWLPDAMAACGIAADRQSSARDLWQGVSGRQYAVESLSSGDTTKKDRILQAVAGVSAEDRQRLKTAFIGNGGSEAETEAAVIFLQGFARSLELPDPAMDMLAMLILSDEGVHELEAAL